MESIQLYKIAKDMQELQHMDAEGENAQQAIIDTLEAVSMEFNDKIVNCAKLMRNLELSADACTSEIKRITEIKNSHTSKMAWLKTYMANSMIATGTRDVPTPLFKKIGFRKGVEKLGDFEECDVPSQFKTTVETVKIDRRGLLAAAKSGPIQGIPVVRGDDSLVIK